MATNNPNQTAQCPRFWHRLSPCQKWGVCAVVVAVLVAIIVVAYVWREEFAMAIGYRAAMDEMTAGAQFFRDFVALFVVAIGIVMAAWRNIALYKQSKAANKQADLANTRLYGDQFANAAELMSKENKDDKPAIAARIGGIYIMADLATKLPGEFAERVVMNLITYIKDNAQLTAYFPRAEGKTHTKLRMLGGDVKAAFLVLHNILDNKAIKACIDEKFLDFSHQNFSNLDFRPVNLQHYKKWIAVDFSGAFLDRAILKGGDLSLADFRCANLEETDMQGCYMRFAKFQQESITTEYTTMKKTKLAGAYLLSANFTGVRMDRVDLRGAILDDADLTGADLFSVKFGETCMIKIKTDESNESEFSELAKPENRKIWLTIPEDVARQNGDSIGGTNWRLEEYTDGYALAGVLMNYAGAPIPGYYKSKSRQRSLRGELENIRRQAAKLDLDKLPQNTPEEIKVWLKEIKTKHPKEVV